MSELEITIGLDLARMSVVVGFEEPIVWFGMKREEAVKFANAILKAAENLPRQDSCAN